MLPTSVLLLHQQAAILPNWLALTLVSGMTAGPPYAALTSLMQTMASCVTLLQAAGHRAAWRGVVWRGGSVILLFVQAGRVTVSRRQYFSVMIITL